MNEYFTQVNPRWTDAARRLVSLDCPECFIDISGSTGFPSGSDPDTWADVQIGLLSSHINATADTWRGRCRLAWAILRGQYSETFSFTSRGQVEAFVSHLREVSERVFPASSDSGE